MLKKIAAKFAQLIIDNHTKVPAKRKILRTVAPLCQGEPLRSRYGVIMESDLRDVTNQLCLLGSYGTEVVDAIAKLQPGDAFIDIGANAGLFSLLAGRQVGDDGIVVAFEPQLRLAKSLLSNFALNGLSNVFPLRAAIANKTDRIKVTSDSNHTGSAHISHEGALAYSLAASDFAGAVSALIRDRRTLIKIDVEGAECQVLSQMAGLLQRLQITAIIVEIDDSNLARFNATRQELYAFLHSDGYEAQKGSDTYRCHYDEVFTRIE